MASTAVDRVELGATTTNRKWYLDVNTGTDAAPIWTGVFGLTQFQPAIGQSLQDDSDFSGGGWGSQINTRNAWSLTGKVKRAPQAATPTAYDPGQEKLRLAGQQVGISSVVSVRWYEMEAGGPRVEAYQGKATVGWSPDGGGTEALDMVSITLTGRGRRNAITHPDASA